MRPGQTHYELYTRKTAAAPWTLHVAIDDRRRAIEQAHALLASRRAAAVRVVREEYDAATHAFASTIVLTIGEVAPDPAADRRAQARAICTTLEELYAPAAREQIGRLFEPWLRRQNATAFELLHSPELCGALERSGVELQGALQKVAIAAVGGPPGTLHDHIRTLQALAERATSRLLADGRRQAFPNCDPSDPASFAAAAIRLEGQIDGEYLLGGGVAARLELETTWDGKIARLTELAQRAPLEGEARAFALRVIEAPLLEVIENHTALAELAGASPGEVLETGRELGVLARLAAGPEIVKLGAQDARLEDALPPLDGALARLAGVIQAQNLFGAVRAAASRRILRELNGPRRLCPGDPAAEIALLRALATALTAASGPIFPAHEVQAAFIERSKRLVTGDFVQSYLADREDPLAEAVALLRLVENVAGPASKTAATRWLSAAVGALRFEKAVRANAQPAPLRLAALADLQHALAGAGLAPADLQALGARLGQLGGLVEADADLVGHLARSQAPPVTRLLLLLKMAATQSAPAGPAAERARAEAMKLIRAPEVRADLATRPDARARVLAFIATSAAA